MILTNNIPMKFSRALFSLVIICQMFSSSIAAAENGYSNLKTIDCSVFHKQIIDYKKEFSGVDDYKNRRDVQDFITQVSICYELDKKWLYKALSQAEYQPSTAKFIMPQAASKRNWHTFKANFLEKTRIDAGVKFWQTHHKWLEQAEKDYGVPPKIILAILGVETIYGQYTGNFRIIDALSTLTFDFPKGRSDRTEYFSGELASFLHFAAQEGIDPLSIRGSFAGAMGMPQFMPTTLQQYAVDYDKDGSIDLYHSSADIIGSVAHYLAEHQWQRGIPASFEILSLTSSDEQLALLKQPDITPSFTTTDLSNLGVRLLPRSKSKLLSDDVKLSFITLENGTDALPTYVLGTQNFYVITRYNRSSFYAMAVIEVANAIESSYKRTIH